jgi:hypothetical protein
MVYRPADDGKPKAVPVLRDVELQYLEWITTPPSERDPRTKQQVAELLGVGVKTLREWERKPHFQDAWAARAREVEGGPERTQRVMESLFLKATQEGDVPAAKLWLLTLEKISPTVRVDQTVTSRKQLSEVSDDELDSLLRQWSADEAAKRLIASGDS